MAGSSAVYMSCRPHARAFLHHHPGDQAQRGGGLLPLPAAAWRRGGAAPRASLVAARTATEEAVYEVVLRQAALVGDLQGRREAEDGRRRWRDEQVEQEGDAELGWASSATPTTAAARSAPSMPRPSTSAAIEAERAKTHAAFEERDRQLAERDRQLAARDWQAAEREREIEERTARLIEEERNRNDAANRAMYELFVSMCEKNGQTPPPMPVIAPAGTHNSRQASTDPSPSATGATGPTPTPTPTPP